MKGVFGARMMLRSIIMKYYYGGNDAHARGMSSTACYAANCYEYG